MGIRNGISGRALSPLEDTPGRNGLRVTSQ